MLKKKLVSVCMRVLDAVGLPQLILAFRRNEVKIFLYHGVSAEKGSGVYNYRKKFISPTAFERQLVWLRQQYTIVPLQEALALGRSPSGTRTTRRIAAITFDDGYDNNYSEAFPILRRMGIPATFFLTTDFVHERKPLPVDVIEFAIGLTEREDMSITFGEMHWDFSLKTRDDRIMADMKLRAYAKSLSRARLGPFLKEIIAQTKVDLFQHLQETPYRPLTWEHISEMEQQDMTFAPHTCSHTIVSTLSEDEMMTEISRSNEIVTAHVRKPLTIFAYPNGGKSDFNESAKKVLARCGFTSSLTTIPGPVTEKSDPFSIPRYTLDGTDEMYRLRLTVSGIRDALSRLIA